MLNPLVGVAKLDCDPANGTLKVWRPKTASYEAQAVWSCWLFPPFSGQESRSGRQELGHRLPDRSNICFLFLSKKHPVLEHQDKNRHQNDTKHA